MHLENEKSVLGACFLENEAVDVALEVLSAEDFANDRHRVIFTAMLEMSAASKPIDLATIAAHLQQSGRLHEVGGSGYMAELTDFVPTAATIRHYAKNVKDTATVRRLAAAAHEIIAKAREGTTAQELGEFAESAIYGVRGESKKGPRHIREGLKRAFDNMQDAEKHRGKIRGVRTGIDRLDWMLSGLNPGRLYIGAARPGSGKSSLAMNIVEAAAIRQKVPTLVFSCEMPEEEVAERSIVSLCRVDGSKARMGTLETADYGRMAARLDDISTAPVWVDETPSISIAELRARARRMKRQHNIGLIVVDYLQLVTGSKKINSREQEVGEVSRGLKEVAKELKVPVIALAQLNRDVEKRENKRPLMADLRESGSIEQDADVIMFIYLEAEACPKCKAKQKCDAGHERNAEIIVAKQRNGPKGTVKCMWFAEHMRFEGIVEGRDYER